MRLDLPVRDFNDAIQVAKLPTDCRSLDEGNEFVTVAGYGQYTLEDLDEEFREATFATIPAEECSRLLNRLAPLVNSTIDTSKLICMNADNGRAPYSGDSGNSPILLAFVKGTILIEIGVFF